MGWDEVKNVVWSGELSGASATFMGGNICEISSGGVVSAYFTVRNTASWTAGYTPPSTIKTVTRPNGNVYRFEESGSDWISLLNPATKLESSGTDWVFTDSDGTKETYNAAGQLILIAYRDGLTETLDHDVPVAEGGDGDSDTLDRVVGTFGHELRFHYFPSSNWYKAGMLQTVTTPDGDIEFDYELSGVKNLLSVTYPDSSVREYLYEHPTLFGHLTGIIDENGIRQSSWDYDDAGRAVLSERADSQERVEFAYNPDGTTTLTLSDGSTRVYDFAVKRGAHRTESVSGVPCADCPDGGIQSRTYDNNGYLDISTDWNGNSTRTVRNSAGLTETLTEGYGSSELRSTTINWNLGYRIPEMITRPSVVAGQAHVVDYTYKQGTALVEQIVETGYEPDGTSISRTTSFQYNSYGQLTEINGPRTDVADITVFRYHECTTGQHCGQLREVENALNQVTRFEAYDVSGRPTRVVDANQIVTTYAYDDRGRLLTVTEDPAGVSARTTHFTYSNSGQLKTVTDPESLTYTLHYTPAGDLDYVEDGVGNRIDLNYDSRGNLIEQLYSLSGGAAEFRVGWRYDANGMMDRTYLPNPLGGADHEHIRVADKLGLQQSLVSPEGRTTSFPLYDALNRLRQTTDAATGVTTYAYNVQDKLIQVTAPNGASTAYQYDDFGRLLRETSPDRGVTSYVYDAADNPRQHTNALGQTVATTYDALNRPLTISNVYVDNGVSTTEQIQLTWDIALNGIGRLARAQTGNRTVDQGFEYDGFGRLATETLDYQYGVETVRISYGYDDADRITSLTQGTVANPALYKLQYSYDSAGRTSAIDDVTSSATSIVSSVTYAPFGPRKQVSFGNGLQETRVYDQRYRLSSLSLNGSSGGTSVYEWSADDNLLSVDDAYYFNMARGYGYDSLDRLELDEDTDVRITYQYDANGNRTQYTETDIATGVQSTSDRYSYTANSNRLQSIEDLLAQTPTFEYPSHDAAGRLIDSDSSLAGQVFDHDGLGQLRIARDDSGAGSYLAHYDYGTNGARVAKEEVGGSGDVTLYSYDPNGRLIGELISNGGLLLQQRSYVWLDDTPVAMRVVDLQSSTSDVYYLHTDHLQTVRLVTESSGNVSWRWKQDSAFGEGSAVTYGQYPMMAPMNLRFPGQYYDQETGLNYNYYRTYDPSTGRYLESDPIGLIAGLNTYSYVGSMPTVQSDSFGLINDSGRLTGLPQEWQDKARANQDNQLSPFEECFWSCMGQQLGLQSLAAAGAVAAGQPITPKRFVTPGSSSATSPLSNALNSKKRFAGGMRPWAPTNARPLARTPFVGRFFARWIPILGWGILTYDANAIRACTSKCLDDDRDGQCDAG